MVINTKIYINSLDVEYSFGWDSNPNITGTSSQRSQLLEIIECITIADYKKYYRGMLSFKLFISTLRERFNYIYISDQIPNSIIKNENLIAELIRIGIVRTQRDLKKIRCIYFIEKLDGTYIGRSFDLIARLNQHHHRIKSCGGLVGLTRRLREYKYAVIDGEINIKIMEILENDNESIARDREQFWINELRPTLNKRNEIIQ